MILVWILISTISLFRVLFLVLILFGENAQIKLSRRMA